MLRIEFQLYYKGPGMNPSDRAVKRFVGEYHIKKQYPLKVEKHFTIFIKKAKKSVL